MNKWELGSLLKFAASVLVLSLYGGATVGAEARVDYRALSKLHLASDATRGDTEQYILKIHEISSVQDNDMFGDPQIAMLAGVGSENMDLLIKLSPPENFYTAEAVKTIALREHKQLILDGLIKTPRLIDVVVKYGWQSEAKETLLSELKLQKPLPATWVSAIAEFEDPEVYPDLISYFLHTPSKRFTYNAIKNLPGIDLEEAVSEAWENEKSSRPPYQNSEMVPIALEYGKLGALDAASLILQNKSYGSDYFRRTIREAVRRHVGPFRTDEAFLKWLELNKGSISFDSRRKVFGGNNFSWQVVDSDLKKTSLPAQEKRNNGRFDKISKQKLSSDATRAEVEKYIQKIIELSSDQRSYSVRDPQVEMLMAVGPDNLDLLIKSSKEETFYTFQAIKKLARPEHKELILENLAQRYDLIHVVVKYGWEHDAKETLLSEFMQGDYLPSAWLSAIVTLEDPEVYPDLIAFFVRGGSSRRATHDIIKNLPNIELEEAVQEAWRKAKHEADSYVCLDMIPVAMEWGLPDALDFAANASLRDNFSDRDYRKMKVRDAIYRHVGKFDTHRAFREWVVVNKDAIHFDPETKIFIGTYPPESMLNSNAGKVPVPSDG